MENFYKKLGQLIKGKRLENNLTTQELANILNVSLGFMSNLENGKTDTFNVELMLNLNKTLGISLFNFTPISDEDLQLNTFAEPEQLSSIPNSISSLLSANINAIANAYISTIKKHNFDTTFIDKITYKVIQEINYIDDFKL